MRVTIVSDDARVVVNGRGLDVDLSGISSNIHAVQWYSSIGEVEYRYDFLTNTRNPNLRFTSFSSFQVFVDRWIVVANLSTTPLSTSILSTL